MKLRFWQKTYLLTLLLFVFFLCGGVFFVGLFSQERTLSHEKKNALSEHAYRVSSLQKDMQQVKSGSLLTDEDIFTAYGQYYRQKGIRTEFRRIEDAGSSTVVSSDLPEALSTAFNAAVLKKWNPFTENGSMLIRDGGYFFCAVSPLDEAYCFVSVTDFSPLFAEMASQRRLYTLTCLVLSMVLAVVLFFVLKRIAAPLQELSHTADRIAGGALTVRARVQGHDEISELAESFNNMAQSVETKVQALETAAEQKERIADNLSHEIRTPLTAIQGYAEYMILAALSEEEREKALGYIIEESRRLQKISDRMLKLSVMRREEVELVPLSVSPILSHVRLTITAKAAQKSIHFAMDAVPDLQLLGDEILLESLLINVADNAVKACEPGDFVTISFTVSSGEFCVSIQDTGHGMTEEELGQLGEPFYRPDKARSRKAGGAGLGITLCRQIVQLHHARMIYYSKIDVGTEVRLIFPLPAQNTGVLPPQEDHS